MAGEAAVDYGIKGLWAQSDAVGKGVFVILAIMSLYSWYVMLTKWFDQRELRKTAEQADKDFWSAPSLQDGLARLKGEDNGFRALVKDGLQSMEHHELNKVRLT